MAIPKKRKPLADKDRIAKAVEIAERATGKPDKSGSISQLAKDTSSQKKIGRPALAGERTARITFYLSEETLTRFELGFLQEKYKQAKKGKKIDKSLIIENILKEWLDTQNY